MYEQGCGKADRQQHSGTARKSRSDPEQLSARLQFCCCDVTRSALAKIEVGQRHLYPDELILIKQILDVSFDELLDV